MMSYFNRINIQNRAKVLFSLVPDLIHGNIQRASRHIKLHHVNSNGRHHRCVYMQKPTHFFVYIFCNLGWFETRRVTGVSLRHRMGGGGGGWCEECKHGRPVAVPGRNCRHHFSRNLPPESAGRPLGSIARSMWVIFQEGGGRKRRKRRKWINSVPRSLLSPSFTHYPSSIPLSGAPVAADGHISVKSNV